MVLESRLPDRATPVMVFLLLYLRRSTCCNDFTARKHQLLAHINQPVTPLVSSSYSTTMRVFPRSRIFLEAGNQAVIVAGCKPPEAHPRYRGHHSSRTDLSRQANPLTLTSLIESQPSETSQVIKANVIKEGQSIMNFFKNRLRNQLHCQSS